MQASSENQMQNMKRGAQNYKKKKVFLVAYQFVAEPRCCVHDWYLKSAVSHFPEVQLSGAQKWDIFLDNWPDST